MIQTDSQSSAAGILHQFLQLHVLQLNVLHDTCTITANIIHILHGFQGDIPEYFAIIVTHEKKPDLKIKKVHVVSIIFSGLSCGLFLKKGP